MAEPVYSAFSQMDTGFKKFSGFPPEIRDIIWECAVDALEPHMVK
jgi:hypothetical protein